MSKKRGSYKKSREEERAIGEIYQQYIDTFQENNSQVKTKTFVKSSTLFAEKGKELLNGNGQIYKPKPLIKAVTNKNNHHSSGKDAVNVMKHSKSNLKALGDELKLLQQERQSKIKELLPTVVPIAPLGNYDRNNNNLNSTNLFISNLNSKLTENNLIEKFGIFGPLASVKIMWPRGETITNRAKVSKTNCGFVAFMSRKDAERALISLHGQDDMTISWGKCVQIPSQPIFIPLELRKLYLPPTSSGLPFNAQPLYPNYKSSSKKLTNNEMDELLYNSIVKVTIPFDKKQLMQINRMVEFVVIEGPKFEAFIMKNEMGNPNFKFLSDYQSPEHIYYRWKLFSILNGDSKSNWSMTPFRMFKGGSIWIPPSVPNYANGMPIELTKNCDSHLTEAQKNRFLLMIKNLDLTNISIAKATVFCFNHFKAINNLTEILIESFNDELIVSAPKNIAKLYLISDLLYNCNKIQIQIEKFNENSLNCKVFDILHNVYMNLKSHLDKKNYKYRIVKVLKSWMNRKYFSDEFLIHAENFILNSDDIGTGSDDEPLDGANLIKRSMENNNAECEIVYKGKSNVFVESTWNVVDPNVLESQAMSTKKMFELDFGIIKK